MKDANKDTNEPALDAAVAAKIAEHYHHARAKHPYFCDLLYPTWMTKDDQESTIARQLKRRRRWIGENASEHRLMWDTLANCEVWEVHEALARGDKAAAVEECYDVIAVFLRIIDVLEGRQALGKPKESEAKA